MSFNRVVLPLILVTLAVLAGCSSSSSPKAVCPPSGCFSNSNLNGTYVFSVSGTDANGAPYAIVGTFAANGSGGITAGTLDINDEDGTTFPNGPLPNQSVNSSNSSYSVGEDGRGKVILGTSTPFNTVVLDFVLQDSSHGLVSELDGNASGSGTLDIQTAGVSPSGTYAFSFGGADASGDPLSTVGNFTVGNNGAITGLEDFNDNLLAYTDGGSGYALMGTVVLGPSSTPGTTLNTTFLTVGEQTYDVYSIDATHLKFIEMDTSAILSGDAFSQTSATISAGTYAFTLGGEVSAGPSAAGGFLVTDGSGNITNASSVDVNEAGTVSQQPLTPTGQYASSGSGRYMLTNLTSFLGTTYVAYPYGAGLFLLEIDDAGGMSGAAYSQSSTSFASSAGYGLNLTGATEVDDTGVEVDDIAEFANSSASCGSYTSNVLSGIIDENYDPAGGPTFDTSLCGEYAAPDANGRGGIATTAGSSSKSTLNGGFTLSFYTVDGTTFPFIEMDTTQVAIGTFVVQSASEVTPASARSHLFLVRTMIRPPAALRKQKQK